MALQIQQQIAQRKEPEHEPAGLCSIQHDDETTETFLPSQAFEMDTSETLVAVLNRDGNTRGSAGCIDSSRVLQEMQAALENEQMPALPCPTLDMMDEQV